jgi:hypothetical protein
MYSILVPFFVKIRKKKKEKEKERREKREHRLDKDGWLR